MPDLAGKNTDHDRRYAPWSAFKRNFRLGNWPTGNYSIFEEDGTYRMVGDATVWDDLRVPGLSVRAGAVAPDLIQFLAAGNLRVYGFNGAGLNPIEEVYFTIQFPHSYMLGTDVYPHVHWTPVNGNAGNVYWQLDYSWADIDDVFPAVTTIGIADAAAGVAWTHQYAPFAAINGAARDNVSNMLVCRLWRDPGNANDTYGSDAAFLEFDVHFQLDTIGSRQEMIK
jgi:hypothetical protein